MKFFKIILTIAAIGSALAFTTGSERSIPTDYFASPVPDIIRLSGSFGELRPGHFHGGIDIKGYIGKPIYAAGPGQVSRISVSGDGYGNVIYLEHPNGFTTVYAHLDSFHPDIAAWVKREQEQRASFAVDLRPEPGQFQFAKGDLIARVGTTGRSGGPHLHFEVRETATQDALNPLRFGLHTPDSRPPRMHQIKIYGYDDYGVLHHESVTDLSGSGGNYRLPNGVDTLVAPAGRVGLALKVYDHMDGVPNWNGIYALSMYVDGQLHFGFRMDEIVDGETRYLNAHLDYAAQKEANSYFNRCFVLPGNRLSIYRMDETKGWLELPPGVRKKILLVAEDVEGNRSELAFDLVGGKPLAEKKLPPFRYFLSYDQEHSINTYYVNMRFPAGAFYQDLRMDYHADIEPQLGAFSPVHRIHDPLEPIHHPFELAIRPTLIPDLLRDKAYIARCTPNNGVVNAGGRWRTDGLLETRAGQFGDYVIMVDTIPPRIVPERFSTNLPNYSRISFSIKDDVPGMGLDYRATIDGQWILMEYDAKNDRITHFLEEELAKGRHELRIEVRDERGNTSVFSESFVR